MPSHFHSAVKSRGIERGEILLLDRVRQHRRAERRRIARSPASRRGLRARRTARCRAARGRARAARSRPAPCRRAPRPRSWRAAPTRRCAAAGDELEQRPAAGLVERIEPARELRRQSDLPSERGCRRERGWASITPPRERVAGAAGGALSVLHPLLRSALAGGRRPHQRDRLGEIADIVVGQLEQHRIGALGDQRADDAGLGVLERQRAGERRQRIAALGIGRGARNSRSISRSLSLRLGS